MSSSSHTRQTIIRLLSSMASAKEINQYLKRFSQRDARRFAVVKVGGAVIRDDLEALISSLCFLQEVGLTPIVVHGAGPQLDARLASLQIETQTVAGLRVTNAAVLTAARHVFLHTNIALVDALQTNGARATSLTGGVFDADYLDQQRWGYVGNVTAVNVALIESCLQAGSIPVIASLGETASGQRLNLNADMAVRALIETLQPYKIIFLTRTGGLLDETGCLISSINLSTDYDDLMQRQWLHGGMKLKIQQIKEMLDALPQASSVSITKPDCLAKELFTHKGSGTLLRRGERVRIATHWDALDLERLRQLIESSFGRRLVDTYFAQTVLRCAYVSENYRAAIIVSDANGEAYLDKFAVLDEAQGEGLGHAVWSVMREQISRLFWRSRHGNYINQFYSAESDGCIKQHKWLVYWYGFDRFEDIGRCVEQCQRRPETLHAAAFASPAGRVDGTYKTDEQSCHPVSSDRD